MIKIIIGILALSLTGIAHSQFSADSVAPTTCKVYFIRATGSFGSLTRFSTFIDGTFACKLKNNTYSVHDVSAGQHFMSIQFTGTNAKEKAQKLELNTEPNKSYYILVIVEPGMFIDKVYCEEITEASAIRKIAKLSQETACK